ncbi:MAG: LuxR C-terminal-related transcriptional regulator [Spirochaetota bacterium]
MYLPSALDGGESILCLYRTSAERMHAVLQFVLSGAEEKERVIAVLDERSSSFAKSLIDHVAVAEKPQRYRSMPGEDFVRRGPLDAERVVGEIRHAVQSWRGRPSTRAVRVVVDLHFVLGALGSAAAAVEFSRGIGKLTAELPVICLCLLFTEQVPRRGLQSFLESFSRFIAAEPVLSTDGRSRGVEPSKELDAALDRLLLSDETVMKETAAGTARRLDYLSARAFLRVAGDHVVILDQELGVEYMEAALSRRLVGTGGIKRGTPLSAFVSEVAYPRIAAAFRCIGSEKSHVRESRQRIVLIPLVSRFEDELVFEASVSAVSAYDRVFGFVCVLRDAVSGGESRGPAARERAEAVVAQGALLKRVPRKSAHGHPWKWLPAPVVRSTRLTAREVEVLELTLNGERTAEVAERLSIAAVTVKKHRANGYRKLGVRDRFELYGLATTSG